MNRFIHHKTYWWLLALTSLVYLAYMFLDVMEVDAAQYASMSFQMMQSGEFLEVTCRGEDYLDKPPLLFWLSSISMWLLGPNNFAYKLPSILALFLAIYSVYKIAQHYYSERGALFSAIILATSVCFFKMALDVRTDNLLIGFSTFAVWQMVRFIQRPNGYSASLAGVGIGLAMLAKGPLGLIFPLLSIVPQIIYTRNWKVILNTKWLFALPVVAVLLLPMCIGLYNQHGSHGLFFFFWEQSFGRITGDNAFVKQQSSNHSDPFFLVHTFFWAFLPWTAAFIGAFIMRSKELVVNKFRANKKLPEVLGWCGYLLPTMALSQSKFQLDHYIFIAAPMAAVLTGGFIDGLNVKLAKRWTIGQDIFSIALLAFISFVALYVWDKSIVDYVLVFLIVGIALFLYRSYRKINLIWSTAFVGIIIHILLCFWFFKPLLKFQATAQAGKYVRSIGVANHTYYLDYMNWSHSMDFYARNIIEPINDTTAVKHSLETNGEIYVMTHPERIPELQENFEVTIVKEFKHHGPNHITLPFLNRSTREKYIYDRIIVKAEKKKD
jgi:4-amino-4-deoxy-L-arabinose transferase-like glycosyltransferase